MTVSRTVKNEKKEQKNGFISMYLGALRALRLWNMLTKNMIKETWKGVRKRSLNARELI